MKLTPETLEICRSTLKITQGELGRLVGVTGSMISAIERQDRILTADVEHRIREAFRVSDDELASFINAHNRFKQIAQVEGK
ncbi:helix-turn-helix domain-containing protein [Sporosarcina sp. D27]|uniref:helix-turn-helix domain-containing protein n=1 Tax=Sporosarcina sp. D27 TaxID=1382305 RepID=UPI00047069AF|nr:helix-turn-helix transcriptional regulator [Sporosarcina sp. D27]